MNELRFYPRNICVHPVEKVVSDGTRNGTAVIFAPCGKEMVGRGMEKIMFCTDGHRAGVR